MVFGTYREVAERIAVLVYRFCIKFTRKLKGVNVIKIFHVAVDSSSAETEALREVKPPRLLLSYFYFRNKPLKQFIEKLGYKPEIMLDSGAYSAWTKGKGIALTDYMKYIEDNQEYITNFINLDVFGDNEMSFDYFMILKKKRFSPIPVVQYGDDQRNIENCKDRASCI